MKFSCSLDITDKELSDFIIDKKATAKKMIKAFLIKT